MMSNLHWSLLRPSSSDPYLLDHRRLYLEVCRELERRGDLPKQNLYKRTRPATKCELPGHSEFLRPGFGSKLQGT